MIKTGPTSEKQVRQFLFLKEMKITPKGARAYTHIHLKGGNIHERKTQKWQGILKEKRNCRWKVKIQNDAVRQARVKDAKRKGGGGSQVFYPS